MNEKLVVKAIPSSFVTRPLKIRGDAGAGEAKLFVGPKKKEEEYNSFFEFGKGYKYVFSKDNLLEYLNNTTLQLFQKK